MRTHLHVRCAVIVLAVLGTGCAQDAAPPTAVPVLVDQSSVAAERRDNDEDDDRDDDVRGRKGVATLAFIGDVPYEPRTPVSALSLMPALIGSINADPDVQRAVHLGDIKSGSTLCSDAWFSDIAAQFRTFSDPLVYSIGDNEWTDCHRANNGGFNPLDRLRKVRDVFFPKPGFTLGRRVKIDAQRLFPENQRFSAGGAIVASLHVIGSNNGRDSWFTDRVDTVSTNPLVTVARPETSAEGVSREAEYRARNAANLRWLDETFEEAREDRAKGVVLVLHADLWHPGDRAGGSVFTAHTEFVQRLAKLAARFRNPVLLISGDSHDYRVDTGVPWFSLYGVEPVSNVTQLIIDRSIEADVDWLKLTIDPRSPSVFSWEQVFVPIP